MLKAILNGQIITFPMTTTANVSKYLKNKKKQCLKTLTKQPNQTLIFFNTIKGVNRNQQNKQDIQLYLCHDFPTR